MAINIGGAYGEATATQTISILNASAQAGVPVMLVGEPGVGKTAMLNAWSRENGYGEPIVLLGSTMDPTDAAGVPFPDKTHTYTEYLAPVWQKLATDGKPHVVFLDEFSNTSRATQSSLLKLLGERLFANGEKLPDNVVLVGAMNPETSAVDYNQLGVAMCNRVLFVPYAPSAAEFYEGMLGGWFEDYDALPAVERAWRKRVVGFLKQKPNMIQHKVDELSIESAAYENEETASSDSEKEIMRSAWASPRSWDNLCRVLGSLPLEPEVSSIQERIIGGMVGRRAQVEFCDWVHSQSQIDPFDAIKNPEKLNWNVSEMTSLDSMSELVASVVSNIENCDGKDGRPDGNDAVAFFEKIVEFGGAPLFAPTIGKNGDAIKGLRKVKPEDVTQSEWTIRLTNILVAYNACGALVGSDAAEKKRREKAAKAEAAA